MTPALSLSPLSLPSLTFQGPVQGVKGGLHKVGQVVLLLEDGDLERRGDGWMGESGGVRGGREGGREVERARGGTPPSGRSVPFLSCLAVRWLLPPPPGTAACGPGDGRCLVPHGPGAPGTRPSPASSPFPASRPTKERGAYLALPPFPAALSLTFLRSPDVPGFWPSKGVVSTVRAGTLSSMVAGWVVGRERRRERGGVSRGGGRGNECASLA